jgi:hypothetical protein
MAKPKMPAMTGRDQHDSHRTATPFELMFDPTFVVASSLAGTAVPIFWRRVI